jgi:peptidoglycan/LPS O-acetylase OafA/YrhL
LSAIVIETAINLCIVLCVLRVTEVEGDRVTAALHWRPAVFVGGLSYSIYLWQQPFLDRHSTAVIASFPLNLLLVACAALASYYLIERPFLALRSARVRPAPTVDWGPQAAKDIRSANAYSASVGASRDAAQLSTK